MIRYLSHSEIEKHKWDNCITHAFNGIIYAYSWYLDIVSPNWDALVMGNYEYVMPLTWRKKHGFSYLYNPPFTQQLGVFSVNKLTEDTVDSFFDAIPQQFKFIDINLNTFNKINLNNIEIERRLTHELDLIESYEDLRKNYSENTKRNSKKGFQNGCKIIHHENAEIVIDLFKNNKGKEFSGITQTDYDLLNNLVKICLKNGTAQVWHVIQNDHICAGAIFVESNNKVIFLFSGLNERGKELGAMSFLLDSFIKHNSQRNLTLDFEGSNDPNLARFYKSFGSSECVYLRVTQNRLPLPFKWFK